MASIIKIKDLKVGMHVEVTNKYTSNKQNGMVVHTWENRRTRFIDGRPIQSLEMGVDISCDRGGNLVLNTHNYNNYEVFIIE